MRLPGPPTCSFCAADDARTVLAGAQAFICGECVVDATSHVDATVTAATCALCARSFGSRAGVFRRRRRERVLARGGVAACSVCLAQARRIVARHAPAVP